MRTQSESAGANRDNFVRRFHEDGFVVIPGVFWLDEIADLRSKLHLYIDQIGPRLTAGEVYYEDADRKHLKALHNLERHSADFENLRTDSRLAEIVESIFSAGVIAGGCSLFAKSAGVGSITPPHQDQAFQFWEPAEALTVTIAIDESTPQNGMLVCLKGSHRLGLLSHLQSGVLGFSRCMEKYPPDGDCEEVGLSMKPGDVSLHH